MGEEKLRIVMLPWLAHGHISPFIELAKHLSTRNFQIYFCSTAVNLSSFDKTLSQYNSSIHKVQLHLPSTPVLPPHFHTTKGLPLHLQFPLMKAYETSVPPILSSLLADAKPHLVIYDMMGHWVPDLASAHGIPAVNLVVTGAASASFFLHLIKRHGADFPFPDIFLRDSYKGKLVPHAEKASEEEIAVFDYRKIVAGHDSSSEIILIKASTTIEQKYIDYFADLTKKRVVALGPLLQPIVNICQEQNHDIIDWLDTKTPCSCVFISFGSECYLSKEDMHELAHALEMTRVDFIWVVRFPEGEKLGLREAFPDGFLERTKEKGVIVEGWAPQVRILSHANVGAYVCHCGWGSTLESVYYGVPIIAMPMQLEHPIIGRLVEEAGVGVEVLRDEEDGKFKRDGIAKVIEEVIGGSTVDGGGVAAADLRRRVKDMSEKMRVEAEEAPGLVSEELRKLCLKCQN